MSQGKKANFTGNVLEQFIQQRLINEGYKFVTDKKNFKDYKLQKVKAFTTQYPIPNKGIYGTRLRCDVFVYHPKLYPDYLAIECKWQQSSGSVDEKFPYLVKNIKERYTVEVIIVLDGGGYKPGAREWLKNQIGGNLLEVFNMQEFTKWCNNGNI